MECPVCRTSNTSGIEYCTKCGRKLESPQEVNYAKVDVNDYITENEFDFSGQSETTDTNEFDFGEQLKEDSVNEFDFGEQFKEDSANEFDFGGHSETDSENFDFGEQNETNLTDNFNLKDQFQENPANEFDFSGQTENITNDEPLTTQPYTDYTNNSVPLPAPPYNEYNSNAPPVYPPQFIGYDQNGFPIYAQPQFVGYDQNGFPVYTQQPIYNTPYQQSINNSVPIISTNTPQSVPVEHKEVDEATEKFIDFIKDDENNSTEPVKDDFFGKSSDISSVDVPIIDVGNIKKRERKKTVYMTDVEIKDTKELVPNTSSKFNQKYMKQAGVSNSNDLGEKKSFGKKVSMGQTKNVDAGMLSPKTTFKSRIKMGDAGQANPDNLESYTPAHKKYTMTEADHAVEALPKKKKYVDELDLIELPPYMKNHKKSKEDKEEFPSMSDL